MTVFEKKGHPAKNWKCRFWCRAIVDFLFVIMKFFIIINYSVKKLRAVVIQYPVNVNVENERLENFTLFPYTTFGYITLFELPGKMTCSR